MKKNEKAVVRRQNRSIYSKLLIRVLVCGYLLVLSILKCLRPVPETAIHNTLMPVSILLVLLAVYFIMRPLETEDEMVRALYAKADSFSDTVTQIGLLALICLLNLDQYNGSLAVSSEVLTVIISGLLFFTAVIRTVSIFHGSRKGV